MNTSFPIYDIVLDGDSCGLTAISLVDEPAIMEDFIAFKKEKMVDSKLWFSNNEKREIVSPILIPNQLILRQNEEGGLYYIRWSEKTIRQAAEKYLANGWFNNFTVMHPTFYDESLTYEDVLEKDVYMLRMWIIDNPETDDAKKVYGFDLPKGTLMVHLKCHNRKIWQRVKNGELKGLSIEAFTNMVKVDNDIKLSINMSKFDVNDKQLNLFQKFIKFLNEVSADVEGLVNVAKKDESESGEVSLKYWVDEDHYIEVDGDGYCRDENKELVSEGKYMLADGNFIIVDSDNKFVATEKKDIVEGNDEVEQLIIPIAEKKKEEEEEKEEEKDETKEEVKIEDDGEIEVEDDKTETEDGSDTVEVEPETDDVDGKESEDEGTVEGGEGTEEVTEEPPLSLMPYEIDGVEYLLPKEVVDYINKLSGKADEIMSELSLMKERMPSAKPIPTVIAQKDASNGLFNAIRLLNK